MQSLLLIENAFSGRIKPAAVIRADAPDTDEYQDASKFLGIEWNLITCSDLERWPAAISGFTPEAFIYYLPAILSASIREDRPNLIANDAVINMLDRSNSASTWDIFFIERWCRLTKDECDATQHWIMWLSEFHPNAFNDSELSRSMDTLELIANSEGAIPIALR